MEMAHKTYTRTIDNILSYYQGLFYQTNKPLFPVPKIKKSTIDEIGNIKEMLNRMHIKLQYNGSKINCHNFIGICEFTKKQLFLLSVYVYPKHNMELLKSTVSEIKIKESLNSVVIEKRTPHLPIQIIGYSTETNFLEEMPENCVNCSIPGVKYLDDFIKEYHDDTYEKMATILISELYDGTLLDFININYLKMSLDMWSIIIFQVIYTIYMTKTKLFNFVFGNLCPGKIKYQIIDPQKNSIIRVASKYGYLMRKHIFGIPNIGIRIKIVNFNKSFFAEKEQNHDVKYFLESLGDLLINFYPHIPKEIISFIERNKNGSAFEILTTDSLFAKYRTNTIN